MVLAVSRIFGGTWKGSAVSAALIAIAAFYLFDNVLGISLPAGRLPGAG